MTHPLVGRDSELDLLRDRLADPRGPKILVVMGPAGIGKTRLVSEVLPPRHRLTSIKFPQARFALPGYGLRRLAQLDVVGAAALRDELEEVEGEPHGWALLSIFRAADQLVAAHAAKAIVLDDLQWSDELTIAWLQQLSDAPMAPRARIVATLRAVEAPRSRVLQHLAALQRTGDLEVLELEPFSSDDVLSLARSLGHDDAHMFAARLHALTDGLPLAVEEVLYELDRRGTAWELFDITPPSPLPLLTAIVREQVAELTDEARLVLTIVCLLPQPASEQLIRITSMLAKERFDSALEAAIGSGLLVHPRAGVVSFRHELQREAFHSELTLPERRAVHRRIAHILATDVGYPAGPIAHHLVQAGQTGEALEWYERAAAESMRARDPGNALSYLRAALEVCPEENEEMRLRFCSVVVQAARWSNNFELGLDLLDRAEANLRLSRHRARLMVFRARLLSYSGDFDGRVRTLLQARAEFTHSGDDDGLATALGELAFPLGGRLTVGERVAIGQEGLSIAQRSGEPGSFALCAVNLATTTFYAGDDSAFALWETAARALEETDSGTSELAIRNLYNWSLASVAYARYQEAHDVLQRGLSIARSPFWLNSFHGTRCLLLWRTGRWDDALEAAEMVIEGVVRPQVKALAVALRASIVFERERSPDLSHLISAAPSLVGWSDEEFGSIAHSILIRARAVRREPDPTRGTMPLVELVVGSQTRMGWDDLLPALAEVDRDACRRVLSLLGSLRPAGPRGEAHLLVTEALVGHHAAIDSIGLLMDSVERLLGLSEPYIAARALEAAASLHPGGGRVAGGLRARAAEIYESLGADRSLATLLRKSRSSRSSARFRIPQRHLRSSSPGLTPREHDVAVLAARGHTSSEIGAQLGIATGTVKKHLERVKAKLGVNKKSELVRAFRSDPPVDATPSRT